MYFINAPIAVRQHFTFGQRSKRVSSGVFCWRLKSPTSLLVGHILDVRLCYIITVDLCQPRRCLNVATYTLSVPIFAPAGTQTTTTTTTRVTEQRLVGVWKAKFFKSFVLRSFDVVLGTVCTIFF